MYVLRQFKLLTVNLFKMLMVYS